MKPDPDPMRRARSHILPGIPKLPAAAARWVMPLILSILMTCVVSLVSTWRGLGMPPGFARLWLEAWLASWLVAFPVLLLVLPLVRRMTAWLVHGGV